MPATSDTPPKAQSFRLRLDAGKMPALPAPRATVSGFDGPAVGRPRYRYGLKLSSSRANMLEAFRRYGELTDFLARSCPIVSSTRCDILREFYFTYNSPGWRDEA